MYSIYNTVGQKVKTVKLEQGTNTIDISSLESGMYIIRSERKPEKVFRLIVK
ncbi:MAG: T9SS type A sorting domain-containing protein [Bacteroidales bacterium]